MKEIQVATQNPYIVGSSLHFIADCRKPGTAYLMFPHEDVNFRVFEFDSEFDKTLKNQAFHHFSNHQKSPLTHPKIP